MKTIIIFFFTFLLLLFNSSSIFSTNLVKNDTQSQLEKHKEQEILLICSYDTATRRVTDFMGDFKKLIDENNLNYNLLVKSMDCKSITYSRSWKFKIRSILDKYKSNNTKAIILIGQEAWATYLSLDQKYKDTPCFISNASTNGINLDSSSNILSNKVLKSIDYKKKAEEEGNIGGILHSSCFYKNIKLIQNIYPEIENIAFLSDNTYGGLSLQANITNVFNKDSRFKSLKLILIDARKDIKNSKEIIKNLPKNTAVLIGTWRLTKDNQFLLTQDLEKMFDQRDDLPIFTISGSGLNSLAIGGYIPLYPNGVKDIIEQLKGLDKGIKPSLELSSCKYVFNAQIIKKFNVPTYKLPKDAEFVNTAESQLSYYKQYFRIGIIVLIATILFLTLIVYLYLKSKKLEKKLLENTKQLTIEKNKALESDKLKSTFLANMSHEIRTPLNAIIGFSALLIEEEKSNNDPIKNNPKKEYVDIIENNSDLLLNIINDILDISTLESGDVSFRVAKYNLYDTCYNAFLSSQNKTNDNVLFVFNKNRKDIEIYTDYKRLTQVINNLLSNAIKFTKEGSINLDYKIDKPNNLIIFSVTDTGSGIPLDKQKTIFNRFEKLNDFVQGTGLGLPICKQIVTKLGGHIRVDENYKDGARFIFTHSLLLKNE